MPNSALLVFQSGFIKLKNDQALNNHFKLAIIFLHNINHFSMKILGIQKKAVWDNFSYFNAFNNRRKYVVKMQMRE